MLVLSRGRDEAISIICYDQYGCQHEVRVYCVDINPSKIKLGIQAPKHMPVHRKEIYDAIKLEDKVRAVHNNSPDTNGNSRD